MQRFSFPDLLLGKNISISDDAFVHQISRVLRSIIDEEIVLFNGDGEEYIYAIHTISKKEIKLTLKEKYRNLGDPEISIRLYQAMPNKYEKIEYILQKGVEVGVSEFVFFRSARSQKLIINERKIERFREIIRESTEQCGGNQVPTITFLESKIPVPNNGLSYVFHTEDTDSKHIRDISQKSSSINLFIGPEGGFSSTEMSFFQENHIQKIHLGARILRTETTGVVATFFLLQR
ncbi:MAG: RsmE family RNA methyltransferase [Candidatus Gracilibacteria bacterium]